MAANIENKIERHLRVYRGYVLKQDLKEAIQAPSMKALREDISKFLKNTEGASLYIGYEQKHHVSLDFAIKIIQHIYTDCKIILIS